MKTVPVLTVGFCPSWDITCRGAGLAWGAHLRLDSQTARPAGKALNVARTLGRLGVNTVAAGFWGDADYPQLRAALAAEGLPVVPRLTVVPGRTRQNITLIDTRRGREMHLRAECRLATAAALKRLTSDLGRMAVRNRTVVFAGSMPEAFLNDCLLLLRRLRERGARLVVDTSGPALKQAVRLGGLALIKPNVEELRELLGRPVADVPGALAAAARPLCVAADAVLVSRGAAGALVVTRSGAWACRAAAPRRRAINTVGCGDALLAGFLAAWDAGPRAALELGVRVAAARAWTGGGQEMNPGNAAAVRIVSRPISA